MFEGFKVITEDEKNRIWENGIFIVDTNVLLNIYKYKNVDNYKNLLNILRLLKEKEQLYIPYHVALEYYFNKDTNKILVENEYRAVFDKFKAEITNSKNNTTEYIREKDSFRIGLIDSNMLYKLEEYIDACIKGFEGYVSELKEDESDILKREQEIEMLLDTIIGKPFDTQEMERIHEEGKKRYENLVPPGYEDRNKNRKRILVNYEYEQRYGDLIIWKHIKNKSIDAKKPILFITDDQKKDWWQDIKGEKKGILPELRQELFETSGQNLIAYTLKNFIKHSLDYYQELNISDADQNQLITETKELERINENKDLSLNTIRKLNRIEKMLLSESIAKEKRKHNNIFDVKTEDTPRNIRTVMIKKHYKSPEIAEKVKSLLEYKYEQYISVENSLDNKELFIMCIPLIEQGVNKILEDLII